MFLRFTMQQRELRWAHRVKVRQGLPRLKEEGYLLPNSPDWKGDLRASPPA